jgi:N-acetylmuramoyl-L-alanine amidase
LTRLPSSSPQPSFALTTTNGILLVRPGSQVAHWRGLEFPLGFAPRLIDGQPYVHSLDLRKSLQPLLEHIPTSGFGHPPVIVIDPGHGGRDAGTHSISGNLAEKDLTLDWARRVQSVLRQNGWQVFLTRTGDEDLTLPDRIARAEEHKADLFLSLHFNSAAPNEVETGFETYLLTPTGMPSTLTRGFEDDPGRIFPNNNFDTQNLHLAVQVHRALLQINGTHDRGVRHARFLGVLRGQQRPAILIEGGYLSNPHEARRIADPEYRQKMAEAVASVLAEQVSGSGTQRADGGGAGMSALTQSVSSP